MSLPWCETGIERDAIAVTQQVDFGAEATNRASECVIAWLVRTIRSVFFGSSRRAVGTHNRAIKRPLLPVNGTISVKFGLKDLQDALPGAIAAPDSIAIINGLPLAIAFGDIRPGCASM
jgi:hypothetical protein